MATETKPRGKVLLEWTFPEFIQHDRGRSWYLGFLLVDIALVVFGLLTRNYTFIGVIVLASFILVIRLRRQPPDVRFAIRENGIEVSTGYYTWDELKEFWIIYQPPEVKKLYLNFRNSFRPQMDITLERQNPLRVRQVLREYLPENMTEENEPATDQLSRFFKI